MKKYNKREQLIIEVAEDEGKDLYLIKVSSPLFPLLQKIMIEGALKENIILFFHLKDY